MENECSDYSPVDYWYIMVHYITNDWGIYTMRKLVKNAIVTLLNPISPIMILIIGWLLTIFVTQSSPNLPYLINFMINNPLVIMIFILFWLVFSIVYTELQNRIMKLEQDVLNKEKIIKEKETQLNHTSGIILNRSGDFANFNKMLRFNDVLVGFVQNNTLVESSQIYRYSMKRIENKVVIKVLYDCGYTYEDVDINNLAQTYYELDYLDYNNIVDIIKVWKRLSLDTNINSREKDVLINFVVENITFLFKKYFTDLSSLKDVAQIESRHFTEYRILTLLTRLARRLSTTTIDKKNILGDELKEIEYYLLNGKRTGILSSILLGDTFMFKYTRNSHRKNGRAYVCFPANISNQNYIIVFSIQTQDLDQYTDFEREITNLKSDFVNRLSKR